MQINVGVLVAIAIYYHLVMPDPNDAKEGSKEVRLSELLTHADLTDKLDDMAEWELLD